MVRAADSLAQLGGEGIDRPRSATLLLQSARAFLALARRDTTGVLRALEAIPDTLLPTDGQGLVKAQLLVARGQDEKAARVLDEAYVPNGFSLWNVFLELERARIAERLRDQHRALQGYRYVVGMWAQADPELQPFVAEAREALSRWRGELG
jgi:hypothetical protein